MKILCCLLLNSIHQFLILINNSIKKMAEKNKRIIVNGSRGVIKYKGPVEGTNGIWVGIDWDEEGRGKHDGSFQGKYYFKASTSKSGSFLREKDLDFGTELFNEIKEKYASELVENDEQNANNAQNVGGGVQWEFVKMEKIHRKQKEVLKLKCIVLSWSNVSHFNCENLGKISFKFCTELDLTKTLVGKWTEISTILSAFPSLKILHLSDNRIEPLEECTEEEMQNLDANLHFYAGITHLSLNRCRLTEYTANQLVRIFANLIELYLAENELTNFSLSIGVDLHLKLLDLQGNPLKEIGRLKTIFKLESLEYLNLSSCQLDDIQFGLDENVLPNLRTLILQNNPINQWNSVEQLANLPSLRKLILRGCPLSGARGVDSREIAIAKLPQIIDLDRCDISPVARRSAELLFLSRFAPSPIDEEHRKTIERLKLIYEYSNEQNEEEQKARNKIHSGIQSKRILLIHGEKSLERTLSLALPIHKIVGLGARIFNFNPDELKGIELRRANPDYPAEMISRTKDNLLRQFDVEDGDKIRSMNSLEQRKIFEFIIELGIRLNAESLTTANASIYLHRVLRQKEFPSEQICPYTLATACILVAGKVTSDTKINTRDAMNISYSILHPELPPLEIGELSYGLREGLIEMELFVLRFLRFRLNFEHPHQDVILILRLLRDWYPNVFLVQGNEIDQVTGMILQDLYVHPQIILDHKPKTLAIAVISMALSSMNIPGVNDSEWAPVFMTTFDERHMDKIKRKILDQVYNSNL